jgi:NADH-quinone oxidoreductase subunit H
VPRFRYDQVMHLGWKMMLPAALVNLAVTAIFIVAAQ